MNAYELLYSLDGIDEKYIKESELGSSRKRSGKKMLLVYLLSAAVILAVSVPIASMLLSKSGENVPPAATTQAHNDVTSLPIVVDPPTEETTNSEYIPPKSELVAYGFVFAYDNEHRSYTVIDVVNKTSSNIIVPESINGIPVTSFKDALSFMERYPGSVCFDKNAVFVGNDVYYLPYENGEFVVEDSGDFRFVDGCLIHTSTGTLLKATENAVIPGYLGITSIAPCAFYDESIKDLVVPEGVKKVDAFAFTGMKDLTSITLPSTLVSIGNSAFLDCGSLEKINIPDLSAWDKIEFGDFYSNPVHCGAYLYENGKKIIDERIEPDKNTDLQAWIRWLTDCRNAPSGSYPIVSFAAYYYVSLPEYPGLVSAWEVFREHFHQIITIRNTDFKDGVDKTEKYTWEIFYRVKDSNEDYRSIVTEPWSYYEWYDGKVLYRLPTYAAGMTDLETDKGEPQTYDLIYVVHKGGTDGEIAGWFRGETEINKLYDQMLHNALIDDNVIL